MASDARFAATLLFSRLFRHIDDGEYDAMFALLHPDITWRLHGETLRMAQIVTAFRARPPTRRVRHMLASMTADLAGPFVAVSAYMLVAEHHAGPEVTGPAPLDGLAAVLTVDARLADDGGGLRFVWIEDHPPAFLRSK